MKVLSLGCGSDTYGDIRVDRVKTSATTEVYNFENGLPYADSSMKEVYMKNVLEHVKDKGKLISECHRVLETGGEIRIITDHAGYLPMYLFPKKHEHNKMLEAHYKANGYNDSEDHHYSLFVPSHLRFLLKDFDITYESYLYSAGRNPLIQKLLRIFPFKLGAMQLRIEGRKK